MKELKFRVYDKKKKQMFDVMCLYSDRQLEYRDGFAVVKLNKNDSNDFVVMQYTGFKDKNNKEVYEGDIVLIDVGDSFLEIKQQCVVRYDNMNASYCFETNSGNKKYLTRFGNPDFFFKNKVEVIGNVYENPELIVLLSDDE